MRQNLRQEVLEPISGCTDDVGEGGSGSGGGERKEKMKEREMLFF
jgi:hypothetical protein